jgi:anti-sigma B factor antagonist
VALSGENRKRLLNPLRPYRKGTSGGGRHNRSPVHTVPMVITHQKTFSRIFSTVGFSRVQGSGPSYTPAVLRRPKVFSSSDPLDNSRNSSSFSSSGPADNRHIVLGVPQRRGRAPRASTHSKMLRIFSSSGHSVHRAPDSRRSQLENALRAFSQAPAGRLRSHQSLIKRKAYLALRSNKSLMSGGLEIIERQTETIDIFALKGRLDASSSQEAEQRINAVITSGSSKILINLCDLDYISSSGLRVLLAAFKRLKKEGGALKLACLKPHIMDVFTMAGFNRIFSLYPDETTALQSFFAGS